MRLEIAYNPRPKFFKLEMEYLFDDLSLRLVRLALDKATFK